MNEEITIMNDNELHQANLLGQGIIDHELQIINKNNQFQMGYEIDTLPTESVNDFNDIKEWINTVKGTEYAEAPKGIKAYITISQIYIEDTVFRAKWMKAPRKQAMMNGKQI